MAASSPLRLTLALTALGISCASSSEIEIPKEAPLSLQALEEGEVYQGFVAQALYLGAQEVPMGARFEHETTGFTVDYLEIQSVPQAFTWVTSYPESNRGEPHTQEHLLLGKGDMGRSVANLEDMSLVSSTAYTQQDRTCYHFNTAAGPRVFFDIFAAQMEALLYPDYTDLEIEREVHHFGVKLDARSGELALEEKGTVYQEMSSSADRPNNRFWRALLRSLYGADHPLALSAGGTPDAIREMTPAHIRTFHRDHYRLDNMGTIVSLPSEISLSDTLSELDALLLSLDAQVKPPADGQARPPLAVMSEEALPPPAPSIGAPPAFINYPSADTTLPRDIAFAWPPTLELDTTEKMLLDLFLSNVAGDANSDLYQALVKEETQVIDSGATGVYGFSMARQGFPIILGVDGVPEAQATIENAEAIKGAIIDQLQALHDLPPGDPALIDFNRRLASRLVATRRGYAKFVNSPPGFGFRGGGGAWIAQLDVLARQGGFERSVTQEATLKEIEARLQSDSNPWTPLIDAWGLLTQAPQVLITRPSAEELEEQAKERELRMTEALASLQGRFDEAEPQAALRRFQGEYDEASAALEATSKRLKTPPFIDAPPLTLDDTLDYEVTTVPGTEIPYVVSNFPTMTGGTLGLVFDVTTIPESQWVYLAFLPSLMSQVGVIGEEGPISWPEMLEALQNEILSEGASFTSKGKTGRVELAVGASWAYPEEGADALKWLRRVLYAPDWREDNLPRIRELIDERLPGFAQVTRQAEERWVRNPAQALTYQNNGHFLVTNSVFTRRHLLYRLKWLFTDSDGEGERIGAVFEALAQGADGRASLIEGLKALEAGAPSDALQKQFAALSEGGQGIVKDTATDLLSTLPGIPDSSLSADFAYLARQLRADISLPPAESLKALEALRESILNQRGARAYAIAAPFTVDALAPGLGEIAAGLAASPGTGDASGSEKAYIASRLASRGESPTPSFPALINPNSALGVFVHSSNSVTYTEDNPDALLTYLSSLLYAGGGGHSLFMQTWSAGLAYSNGVASSPASGRTNYYAERSPDLPSTISFVVDTLKNAEVDPGLSEYAIAQSFKASRAAQSFESRGMSMAGDIQDLEGPETVAAFRRRILALRETPELAQVLFGKMPQAYGPVIPGYGDKNGEGSVLMVIGPEAQMETYGAWLGAQEDGGELTYIYPRDFWIPGEAL